MRADPAAEACSVGKVIPDLFGRLAKCLGGDFVRSQDARTGDLDQRC